MPRVFNNYDDFDGFYFNQEKCFIILGLGETKPLYVLSSLHYTCMLCMHYPNTLN